MERNENTANVAILGFYFFLTMQYSSVMCEHWGGKEKEFEWPKLHKQIFTQKKKKIKK